MIETSSVEHAKAHMRYRTKRYSIMFEECVYCEGVADYIMIDGGWYVCRSCIKDGEDDVVAQ